MLHTQIIVSVVVISVLTCLLSYWTVLKSAAFTMESASLAYPSSDNPNGNVLSTSASDEPEDPIQAARIPPPGYPWTTVGAHYPSADPSILTGIEHMMARNKSWLEGESPFYVVYIRNGKLWTRRKDLVGSLEKTSIIMLNRMGSILNLLRSTLNLAKILKKRACGGVEPCLRAAEIHPKIHELLNVKNVTIPLVISPHDFFEFSCGGSKLPIFTLQVGVHPVNTRLDCSAVPLPFPTYALWKPLMASSIYKPSDWATQKNSSESDHKGDMYSFEGPVSYQLKDMANERPSMWELGFPGMEAMYPWSNKKPKAVWRGRGTGKIRFRLADAAVASPELLDIGLVDSTNQNTMKPPMSLEDFMKYKAIIDVDGRGWSSRFGNLLCMNSVVIKVEPKFTDYWQHDLMPWIHYVPVRNDLGDLVARTRYVMDPANDRKMKNIVRNANEWCQNKLTVTQLSVDMLWILFTYLDMVNDAVQVESPETPLSTQLSRWDNMTAISKLKSLEREAVFSSLLKSE